MFIDEFYFHHKRGLGKWESWGHPIDTLLFLSCYLFAALIPYSVSWELIFAALCVASSLIIIKDEFIHTEQSSGAENFLHAILFILHPLSLIVLYLFWRDQELIMIKVQTVIIALFMSYQILYWNYFKENKYEISNQ